MSTIQASCHCGNLQAELTTEKKPAEMWLRACQCAFCRSHSMRSLSDPEGRMEVRVKDGERLNRYRFGLKTADFLICQNCGNYVGALQEIDGQLYGIMNANLTENCGQQFGEPEPRFYEDQSAQERSDRRKRVWTKASLTVEG
ncbi:MAG TPA: aldehyde-activating protein [Alphaproteobacteria bacterium]|nr:aldehyde-activating protein [Alphaproteobacteria bacterium]